MSAAPGTPAPGSGAFEIPGPCVSRGLRGRRKGHLLRSGPWCSAGTPGLYQRCAPGSVSCYPARVGDKRASEKSGSEEGLLPGWASPRGEDIQGFTESTGVPQCPCVDICFPLLHHWLGTPGSPGQLLGQLVWRDISGTLPGEAGSSKHFLESSWHWKKGEFKDTCAF